MQRCSRKSAGGTGFLVGRTERYHFRVASPWKLSTQQIKSFEKRIANLEAALAKNPDEDVKIVQELNALKEKKSFLLKNPSVLGASFRIHVNCILRHASQDAKAHGFFRDIKEWAKARPATARIRFRE